MELRYKLERHEIEESLLCLDWKKEGWRKYIHIGIMGVIAIVCLVAYGTAPEKMFFFWLGLLAVLLMFAILYLPGYRRNRRAAEMAKGIYKITMPDTGILEGYESEHVFTIRTKNETYCIPKRVLKKPQRERIEKLLKEKAVKYYKITTGR